jgi:lipid-A-disaccharide synthase
MLEIVAQLKGRYPRAAFVAVAPSEERAWQIRRCLRGSNMPVDIRLGSAGGGDAVIRWADLILCKSGTTTLQVARQAKPMVVMFAVPRWQWAIARHFITTPYIALVNILAQKMLVPEFIPFYGSPLPVARVCMDLLADEALRQEVQTALRELVAPLQPADGLLAADRVAAQVIRLLPQGAFTGPTAAGTMPPLE